MKKNIFASLYLFFIILFFTLWFYFIISILKKAEEEKYIYNLTQKHNFNYNKKISQNNKKISQKRYFINFKLIKKNLFFIKLSISTNIPNKNYLILKLERLPYENIPIIRKDISIKSQNFNYKIDLTKPLPVGRYKIVIFFSPLYQRSNKKIKIPFIEKDLYFQLGNNKQLLKTIYEEKKNIQKYIDKLIEILNLIEENLSIIKKGKENKNKIMEKFNKRLEYIKRLEKEINKKYYCNSFFFYVANILYIPLNILEDIKYYLENPNNYEKIVKKINSLKKSITKIQINLEDEVILNLPSLSNILDELRYFLSCFSRLKDIKLFENNYLKEKDKEKYLFSILLPLKKIISLYKCFQNYNKKGLKLKKIKTLIKDIFNNIREVVYISFQNFAYINNLFVLYLKNKKVQKSFSFYINSIYYSFLYNTIDKLIKILEKLQNKKSLEKFKNVVLQEKSLLKLKKLFLKLFIKKLNEDLSNIRKILKTDILNKNLKLKDEIFFSQNVINNLILIIFSIDKEIDKKEKSIIENIKFKYNLICCNFLNFLINPSNKNKKEMVDLIQNLKNYIINNVKILIKR